jgi:hypothetical protein
VVHQLSSKITAENMFHTLGISNKIIDRHMDPIFYSKCLIWKTEGRIKAEDASVLGLISILIGNSLYIVEVDEYMKNTTVELKDSHFFEVTIINSFVSNERDVQVVLTWYDENDQKLTVESFWNLDEKKLNVPNGKYGLQYMESRWVRHRLKKM